MTEWRGPDGHWVSDDSSLIDVDYVHQWLSTQSYWARHRPRDVTARAMNASIDLGLFNQDGTQVGFCRCGDRWCDLCLALRRVRRSGPSGHGLGVFLVKVATEHPSVTGLRLLLGTKDAHELYRKFGFTPLAPARTPHGGEAGRAVAGALNPHPSCSLRHCTFRQPAHESFIDTVPARAVPADRAGRAHPMGSC